ncbi:MAG: hypothetical protein ABI686_05175 [Acidobacteriota bacterium]
MIDNYNAVGFVDLPNENYRITVKSRYQNKGADFNSIKAETDKAR